MATHIYIERSRLGRAIYELKDGVLSVSGTRGQSFVRLDDLSSADLKFKRRFYRNIAMGFIGAMASGAVVTALLVQQMIPAAPLHYFIHPIAIVFATSLAIAITWMPEVRFVRFRDKRGGTAWDFVEPWRSNREFEDFIGRVRAEIEKAKGQTKH